MIYLLSLLLWLPVAFGAYEPNTTEIAWDLHGVILHKDKPRMAMTGLVQGSIIAADLISALACESVQYCWNGSQGATHRFIRDAWGHWSQDGSPEEYKRVLEARDAALGRGKTIVSRIEDIEAEFVINPGMEALVVELNHLGYTQRIASNIGAGAYQRLSKKYNFFDNNLCEGQCVDFRGPDAPRKPSPEFFKRYLAAYNPRGDKTIIFIDDNLKNVEAARKAGMVGIVFNNLDQLRADLQELGIKLAVPAQAAVQAE